MLNFLLLRLFFTPCFLLLEACLLLHLSLWAYHIELHNSLIRNCFLATKKLHLTSGQTVVKQWAMAFWFMDPIGCNQLVAHGSTGMLPLSRSNNITHGKSLCAWQLRGRNWEVKDYWKDTSRKGLHLFFPIYFFLKPIKLCGFCQMTCEITIPSYSCKKHYIPLLALIMIWWNLSKCKILKPLKRWTCA